MSASAKSPDRESMSYDVVIVGGGPAGLAAAIRLKQLAAENEHPISVALLEKGSEIGAHIISGAVIDPVALDRLIPNWREDAPLQTKLSQEQFLFLGPHKAKRLPNFLTPPMMRHKGCYIGSLGELCRWLAQRAQALDVEIYPGFAASDLVYNEQGGVQGVVTGVVGLGKDGQPGRSYQPGMELHGRYTLFAEGARGSLSQQLIDRFALEKTAQPQKFALGLKEVWRVPEAQFRPGLVQHTLGWPLNEHARQDRAGGGGFLYHFGDNMVALGMVVHLDYSNPHLSPYQEFQRSKHHPAIACHLKGAERISYGARAITCGGWQSVPKLGFPGGALIGCAAGFVNLARIKGVHNAMQSGMIAAESAFDALKQGRSGDTLEAYERRLAKSALARELKRARNVKPLVTHYGYRWGMLLSGLDLWSTSLLGGFSPFGTLNHRQGDAQSLKAAAHCRQIAYPKPDGVLSFDRLTNLAFSGTGHQENQPVHLQLRDECLQGDSEYAVYGGPSAHYCPAGVYEWLEDQHGAKRFQINAGNCLHCKTCDIKDPNGNIIWATPEGGGGPNYSNM